MTVEGLFEGIEVGKVVSCTRGVHIGREKYIADIMNELERRGYVVEFIEEGRKIDFYLKDRRKNA